MLKMDNFKKGFTWKAIDWRWLKPMLAIVTNCREDPTDNRLRSRQADANVKTFQVRVNEN